MKKIIIFLFILIFFTVVGCSKTSPNKSNIPNNIEYDQELEDAALIWFKGDNQFDCDALDYILNNQPEIILMPKRRILRLYILLPFTDKICPSVSGFTYCNIFRVHLC